MPSEPKTPDANSSVRADVNPASAPDEHQPDAHPTEEAFSSAFANLREFVEYASYYLLAKVDRFKLSLRQAVLFVAITVVGAAAVAAILIIGFVLLVLGISHGLGVLIGSQWIADILTGVIILAFAGICARVVIAVALNRSRRATEKKYESRRNQQKSSFGHDVAERSGRK